MNKADLNKLALECITESELVRRCETAGLKLRDINAIGIAKGVTAQHTILEQSCPNINGTPGRFFSPCTKQAGETVFSQGPREHLVILNQLSLNYDLSGGTQFDQHRLITVSCDQLDQ